MNPKIAKLFSLRFLANFPKAILIPYFAIWLIHYEQLTPIHAASVVGIYIVMYRSGALLFSTLLVKRSPKLILIVSLMIATALHITFYIFGVGDVKKFMWWFLTALSLGGVLSIITVLILSYQQQISSKVSDETFYAYLNIALNLSSGAALYLGAYMLHHYPSYLPLSPAVFTAFALLLSFFLPYYKSTSREQTSGGLIKLLRNVNFMKFVTASAFSLVGYACFYDLFPLYVHRFLHAKVIGGLFLYGSLLIVVLQMLLQKLIRELKLSQTLMLANMVLAAAVLFLFLGKQQLTIAIIGVTLLSISEMIFLPIYYAQTVKLAAPIHSSHAIALLTALWGFTEAATATVGTYLIAHQHASSVYISAFAISLLLGVYFLRDKRAGSSINN